jgi:hypothetical protein
MSVQEAEAEAVRLLEAAWRDGGTDECTSLEKLRGASLRGFESLSAHRGWRGERGPEPGTEHKRRARGDEHGTEDPGGRRRRATGKRRGTAARGAGLMRPPLVAALLVAACDEGSCTLVREELSGGAHGGAQRSPFTPVDDQGR